MIKSPLRPAMTPPLTSPYDLISRYFRQNTGVSDFYQLLDPVTLTGDFEIEAECFITDLEFAPIFGGAQFGFRTDADGLLRFILPRTDLSLSPRYAPVGGHIVAAGKLNTFTARKSGTNFYVGLNGVEVSNTFTDINASISFLYVAAVDVPNQGTPSARLFGGVTKLRTWMNGDRNTGELIHNFKFDDPNSVYQRNHAAAQSELINDANWTSLLASVAVSDDELLITGNGVNAYGRANNVVETVIGKTYLLTYEFTKTLNNMIVSFNDIDNPAVTASGIYTNKFVATSTTTTVGFKIGNNASGELRLSNISMIEFSGCEIIGGMPEDWFQVERQPLWQYWREVGNELNILEIAQ